MLGVYGRRVFMVNPIISSPDSSEPPKGVSQRAPKEDWITLALQAIDKDPELKVSQIPPYSGGKRHITSDEVALIVDKLFQKAPDHVIRRLCELEDPLTLAKKWIEADSFVTRDLRNFSISAIQDRIALAKHCVEINAGDTAMNILAFEIDDTRVKFQIALQCAERSPGTTLSYLLHFKLSPVENWLIALNCILSNFRCIDKSEILESSPKEVVSIIEALKLWQANSNDLDAILRKCETFLTATHKDGDTSLFRKFIQDSLPAERPGNLQWLIFAIGKSLALSTSQWEEIKQSGILSAILQIRRTDMRHDLLDILIASSRVTPNIEALLIQALHDQGISDSLCTSLQQKMHTRTFKDEVINRLLIATLTLLIKKGLDPISKERALELILESTHIKSTLRLIGAMVRLEPSVFQENAIKEPEALEKVAKQTFRKKIKMPADVSIETLFRKFRQPETLISYLGAFSECSGLFIHRQTRCYASWVRSLWDGSYTKLRYGLPFNDHMKRLFGTRPDQRLEISSR